MKLEVISYYPEGKSQAAPLLFVHGAWHGAWCWEPHFLPYFAGQGYEAHALSLRGHGASQGYTRLRWHSAADYVADVAQVAGRFSTPPVLIGHSMGGYVVQKYLEQHAATAAVLLTPVPASGGLGFFWRRLRRHPAVFLANVVRLSPYLLIGSSQLVRELFFSATMPQSLVEKYFAMMQEESFRAGLDLAFFRRPRPEQVPRLPMLVIGAANDNCFTVAEVEQTAAAYQAPIHIFPDMAHDVMLEAGWQAVADRILAWLAQ